MLKIKTNGDKVWLEVQNGPGEVVGEGAIKPAGKPDAAVSVPLSTWDARKLAFAVLAYVQAWEARHSPSPSQGEGRGEGRPVATKPADLACPELRPELAEGREPEVRSRRMASDVTTGREVEHTPTGFWSLYNTEGRPAGGISSATSPATGARSARRTIGVNQE